MGYFSNGTEGEAYEAQYCMRCVHGQNRKNIICPVWMLHLTYNYEECNKPESMLHVLIPRYPDNVGNEQCSMFIEHENATDPRQEDLL